MAVDKGNFVISLDFELMWGVRDEVSEETYGQHIKGVHTVIPRLLSYFDQYQVKATFATVGFIFCRNKEELLDACPTVIPSYNDSNLSPYGDYLTHTVGRSDQDDPYHYGWRLLEMIGQNPDQEIATHTFSHFYCLEPGQTAEVFEEDLVAAKQIATKHGISLYSIVFPRNQANPQYLDICARHGITNYRGNEQSWIYSARSYTHESLVRRAVRLADSYINLSGHHAYTDDYMKSSFPVNIPSSRFLRPYFHKLRMLEWLRLSRIKKSMTYAAINNLTYHLWWHPHNFGINQDQNFAFLSEILAHYQLLQNKYGFRSITMRDLAAELLNRR